MDERLRELSRSNYMVNVFMTQYLHGGMNYEQALLECVVALASINEKLQQDIRMRIIETNKNPRVRVIPTELPDGTWGFKLEFG